jgi:alpha-methylacyl-CoA racemase
MVGADPGAAGAVASPARAPGPVDTCGMTTPPKPGPLRGLRVVQLAGIGPVPHAARLLADLGADITRVDRPGAPADWTDPNPAGVQVTLDLRSEPGRADVLTRLASADVLMEGFRPGVTERLGLGPSECLARNPGLVYARMTGWGQDGPRAARAGHDINYLALSGFLSAIGTADGGPVPPLNLVGDFGGGSMFLLVGILAALWEREHTGLGQVVDAAMVDGVAVLGRMIHGLRHDGRWHDRREANLLDGGAPFYRTYRCRDGEYVAVGALEPQFYRAMVEGLSLDPGTLPDRDDPANWPTLQARLGAVFATRTRDEWAAVFADTDACVTPVLTLREAPLDDHLRARHTFDADGRPSPAPRFSRPRTV